MQFKTRNVSGELYRLDFASGKSYIGTTIKRSKERYKDHEKSVAKGSTFLVHKAWRKHGPPTLVVIMRRVPLANLLEAERQAIAQRGTLVPKGYNMTIGGETGQAGVPGYSKAQSIRMKKLWSNPEFRAKVVKATKDSGVYKRMSIIYTGRTLPAETRAKQSQSMRKAMTPEVRAKISIGNKGKVLSPETRKKISVALTGIRRSKETCAKIAAAKTGTKATPETRRKMSKSQKRRRRSEHK